MELTTQQIGLITEKEVELCFNKMGYMVSIPTYYHSKYDIIVDIKNKLYKIQIKTSRLTESKNGFMFATYSTGRNNEGNHKNPYSKEEVDFFATVWENKCYLIPIDICGNSNKTLTFEKSHNEQVTWADDYLIEKVIDRILSNNSIIIINKPIKQYNKDNILVGEYISIVEAVKAVKDTDNPRRDSSHISDVINGKRKTAYGYIWRRE